MTRPTQLHAMHTLTRPRASIYEKTPTIGNGRGRTQHPHGWYSSLSARVGATPNVLCVTLGEPVPGAWARVRLRSAPTVVVEWGDEPERVTEHNTFHPSLLRASDESMRSESWSLVDLFRI